MIRNLSTLQQTNNLRDLISTQKRGVDQASMELATGLKQDVFTGRGAAPSQSMEFRSRMSATEAYRVANATLATKLEVTANTVNDVREMSQEFLGLLISGDLSGTNRETLQDTARQALESIVNKLNTTYNGEYLFSGTSTDQEVVTLNPDQTVTYTGGTGSVSSRIDDTTVLYHGIRADDPAITTILETLSTVITTDILSMNHTTFSTFQSDMSKVLAQANQDLTQVQSRLGDNQGRLEKMIDRQSDMSRLYTDSILNIEGVEPEEAAVRLEGLTNQLKSTFEVTARMKEMSFLNFMR